MTVPVLAIVCTGKTVGIALTFGAAVVEAVTVESQHKGAALDNVAALVNLGTRTLTVLDALVTDHAAGQPVLQVVARPTVPSRDGQQRRAISGSSHVVGAAVAAATVAGVVLGGLAGRGIVPVLGDADPRNDKRTGTPDLLTGHVPADWLAGHPARQRRGADRTPQRLAYWLAQRASTEDAGTVSAAVSVLPLVRPVLPTTPPALPTPAAAPPVDQSTEVDTARAYAHALVEHVRAAAPTTDQSLLVAARDALASTPIPPGGRSLTAVDLAVTAVRRGVGGPALWALDPDLRARLGAPLTTTSRSTR